MTAASIDHQADYQVQAKRLLQGIVTAPTRKDRLHVQCLALIAFNHRGIKLHDGLVKAGAATVLTRCLQKAFYDEAEWEELSQLCELLQMVFRCSDERACECFEKMGAELACIIFTILMEDSFKSQALTSSCPFRVLLERLAGLSVSLIKTSRKEHLVRLLQQIFRGANLFSMLISVEAMQILAGFTTHPESKRVAMEYPGLVDDVLAMVLEPHVVDTMYLSVAIFFRNLAWDSRNKTQLVDKKEFIKVLFLLWRLGDNVTRKEVMRTVWQLCSVETNKSALIKYGNGAILHALVWAANQEELRCESIETLLCLAGQGTAQRIVQHTGIIQILASAGTTVGDHRLIVAAAQSLKRLATYITIGESCYQALLDALMSIAASTDANVRFWAAKAFVEQTKMSTNGFYVARMARVMQTITNLAQDASPSVKACAIEALLNLAADTANAKRLAMSAEVLRAFVANATGDGDCEASNKAKRDSVQAILTLASHKSSKGRVAKQIGLVATLSKYGVSLDVDSELRNAALHGVIVLAPLM